MKINNLKGGERVIPKRKKEKEEWGECTFISREDTFRHRDNGVCLVKDKRGHRHFIIGSRLEAIN